MSWTFILILVSFLLFVIYNSVVLGLFGVPESLSETYYLYENKKKGLGWLFTIFMWVLAFTLLPAWIETSMAIGPWRSYLTFLAFFTCAAIVFVGTSPKFHEKPEGVVHTTAAIICAVSALLWDFIVCSDIWYVPLIAVTIPVLVATFTKTWKTGYEYWLEMLAFDATFATVITKELLIIQ